MRHGDYVIEYTDDTHCWGFWGAYYDYNQALDIVKQLEINPRYAQKLLRIKRKRDNKILYKKKNLEN